MNVARIKTGGRVAGTPNKNSTEVRQLALAHSGTAIELLVSLMTSSTNDAVRLAAARELLDRSCGKAVDQAGVRHFEVIDSRLASDPFA